MTTHCPHHPITPLNHVHECPKCKTTWSHTPASIGCPHCHKCPQCSHVTYGVHSFPSRIQCFLFYFAHYLKNIRDGKVRA